MLFGLTPGLILVLAGCRFDGTGTKMQWAPDMADSPTSKPQKSFLDPPVHAVAMNATFYEKTPEAAETVHMMPVEIASDSDGRFEARGKVLFETFCSVCHGLDGKGGHSLGPNFPTPPDITHPSYRERKDGFFFYRITFGTSVMPAYGYATLPEERWMILKHLRTLQSR
jgi:mono/diheme cytochrome c family protein